MPSDSKTLPRSFFANPDVVSVSRSLLGKVLCTDIDGQFTSSIITETEAYCGRGDKASHAYNGKYTERTKVMYGPPGTAYIYLCYGIHHLFNVVTNKEGLADAVLIRGVKPLAGYDVMTERRGMTNPKQLTNGPGKLSQAMGITTDYNSCDLLKPPIWIEDHDYSFYDHQIETSKRVGIDYAEEDADKPWRFIIPQSLLI